MATGASDITNISCDASEEDCPDTFCDIKKCEYILDQGKDEDGNFCWLSPDFYLSELERQFLSLVETCEDETLRDRVNQIPLDSIELSDFT